MPEAQKENLKQCEQVAASRNIGVDSQSKALRNENTDLFITRCRRHLKTLSQKLMSAWLPPRNSETRLRKLWRRRRDWKVITHWGSRIKRRKRSSESSSPHTLSPWQERQLRSRGRDLCGGRGCGGLGRTKCCCWEMDKQIRRMDHKLKRRNVLENSPLHGRQARGYERWNWQRLGLSSLRDWQPPWERQLIQKLNCKHHVGPVQRQNPGPDFTRPAWAVARPHSCAQPLPTDIAWAYLPKTDLWTEADLYLEGCFLLLCLWSPVVCAVLPGDPS